MLHHTALGPLAVAALSCVLLGSCPLAKGQQQDLVVNTTSGNLRGFSPYPGVYAYLGFPYAQPPIKNLRFRPPQPFEPKGSAPRDAFQVTPGCYQINYLGPFSDKSTGPAESEDCLSMNVWKPMEHEKPLPVLIWVYGGGFVQGDSGQEIYSGVRFVAEQKDIIFVSFNYRVNIFGFPNSKGIKVKNPGLLDQRLAIEWIRDNIHAFGGDPRRMTLMGHSAGSVSTAYYSYTYAHDPIVSGLIELSGQPLLLPSDDGSTWATVANTTECSNSDANKEVACMQALPPRDLKRGISYNNIKSATGISGGLPVTDNVTVLTAAEYAARGKRGQFAKLPLLATNTANEFDSLLPFDPVLGVNTTLSDQYTAIGFHCPTAVTAGYWVAQSVPIYRYLLAGIFPEIQPYPWMRPFHGEDNYFVFRDEALFAYQELGQTIQQAGVYMRNAIGSFVRDPSEGLANFGWPKYTGRGQTLVRLFQNGTSTADFIDPTVYDKICQ